MVTPPIQSNPKRQTVCIANWNDDKGFGFVTPHDGEPGRRAYEAIARQQVLIHRASRE